MDKRVEENLRVKRLIVDAFFTLLNKEDIECISISEVTRMAKVSRMAYYRNFNSKFEIIDFFLEDVLNDLKASLNYEINFWTKEYGRSFFLIMKKYRERILLLNQLGLSSMFLNKFTDTNKDFAGDMPMSSIERHKLHYAAGASYNGTIEWLKGGCKESIEEMTQSLGEFMHIYEYE